LPIWPTEAAQISCVRFSCSRKRSRGNVREHALEVQVSCNTAVEAKIFCITTIEEVFLYEEVKRNTT